MKLTFPHYEGDSILRPFIASTKTTPVKSVKPVEILQRTISKADPEPAMRNSLEIDLQARAMRKELLREWIKGVFGHKDN